MRRRARRVRRWLVSRAEGEDEEDRGADEEGKEALQGADSGRDTAAGADSGPGTRESEFQLEAVTLPAHVAQLAELAEVGHTDDLDSARGILDRIAEALHPAERDKGGEPRAPGAAASGGRGPERGAARKKRKSAGGGEWEPAASVPPVRQGASGTHVGSVDVTRPGAGPAVEHADPSPRWSPAAAVSPAGALAPLTGSADRSAASARDVVGAAAPHGHDPRWGADDVGWAAAERRTQPEQAAGTGPSRGGTQAAAPPPAASRRRADGFDAAEVEALERTGGGGEIVRWCSRDLAEVAPRAVEAALRTASVAAAASPAVRDQILHSPDVVSACDVAVWALGGGREHVLVLTRSMSLLTLLLRDTTLRERRPREMGAVVRYLVFSGAVGRLALRFRLLREAMSQSGEADLVRVVVKCMACLEALTFASAPHTPRLAVPGGAAATRGTPLAHVLQESSFCGVVSLALSLIMPQPLPRSAHGANEAPRPRITQDLVPVLRLALRVLANAAREDHALFLRTLSVPTALDEFRHLVSLLLRWVQDRLRGAAPGEDEEAEEVLALTAVVVGLAVLGRRVHQDAMHWGRRPTPLQLLCELPFRYYGDARTAELVLPALLSVVYRNEPMLRLVETRVSSAFLVRFLERRVEDAAAMQAEDDSSSGAAAAAGTASAAATRADTARGASRGSGAAATAGSGGDRRPDEGTGVQEYAAQVLQSMSAADATDLLQAGLLPSRVRDPGPQLAGSEDEGRASRKILDERAASRRRALQKMPPWTRIEHRIPPRLWPPLAEWLKQQ